MNELSLFTGAGGGVLASNLLGWTTIGYVEYDDYCQRVIAQRIKDGIFDEAPSNTEGLRTWLQRASPVSRTVARLEGETSPTKCGRGYGALSVSSVPLTCFARTSQGPQFNAPENLSVSWVTKPKQFPLPRQTWVVTTFGSDIGFLHTPTATANYAAPSMQKWPNCRAFVRVFGKPLPSNQEWLMGWPIGHTDLKPLAMDKFQSWRQQHGGC